MSSARSRHILQPPRLRPLEDVDRERHATWFELFFDLVFVLAITQLSRVLQLHLTVGGFVHFLQLFVPV